MSKTNIAEYENAVNKIADDFVEKYYRKYDPDSWWIGNQVGGVLAVNDDFWDFYQILQATKLKPSKRQLFDWYDYVITNESPMNLKPFLALRKRNG